MKFLVYIYAFAFFLPLEAQEDSVLLTKNFKFDNGIYLTFSDFQSNKPAYAWDEVVAVLVTNPQTFMTQVERINLKDGRSFKLEEIWGLCIDGIPYVQISREAVNKTLASFAGIRARGRMCYFSYEIEKTENIVVSAYNPLNGRPFRTSTVPRKMLVLEEKLLDFETGEIIDFNRQNLLDIVKDDFQLRMAIKEIEEEDLEEKLFKALLIFDDRHPVYIKQ